MLTEFKDRVAKDEKKKLLFEEGFPFKTNNCAFERTFSGIRSFISEAIFHNANSYINNCISNNYHIQKRILDVSNKLWELKIRPSLIFLLADLSKYTKKIV